MEIPLTNQQFIDSEFSQLDLGDKRLNERGKKVASMINREPSSSFPSSSLSKGELKGFYRFFQNGKVNEQNVLSTHYLNTIQRCLSSKDHILLIADTTYVTTAKKMPFLKTTGKLAQNSGIRIHYIIAVTAKNHSVLGITDLIIVDERSKKYLYKESDVWKITINRTVNRIKKYAGLQGKKLISNCTFVGDREADDLSLINKLSDLNLAYVIRCMGDRKILDEYNCTEGLRISFLKNEETKHGVPYFKTVTTRESLRGNIKKREAKLQRTVINNIDIDFSRTKVQRRGGKEIIVGMDAVIVREIDVPKVEKEICWLLLTSHSCKKTESSREIVRIYEARWTIEELNKCAKMGVRLEERQFTDLDHFKPFCSIVFVVGWRLLAIRDISKNDGNCLATEVFSKDEVNYLKAKKLTNKKLTVKIALKHIAEEGGFLGTYKHPGWMVLWQGWFKFTMKVEGFSFANAINSS